MPQSLESDVALLHAQVAELLDLVAKLRATIHQQQAHIERLVKMTFGRSSERVLGPTLFDDLVAEPIVDEPSSPSSTSPEEIVLVPKRKGHGRKKNAVDLPRRREELVLSEAEKACPCCQTQREKIGEKLHERLDYTPASVFVRVLAQPTLVCKKCEQAGLDPQFVKPAVPMTPIPKSGIDAGLLAQIVVSKYVDHLPLNRQVSMFARQGFTVSRSRLCDLTQACGELLEPLYFEMIERVKKSFVLHADETPVKLLQPSRTAYAWVYLGDASQPYTLFDFTAGRGHEHPAKFLSGYTGYLQTDGYAGYHAIHEHTRHLGCWAHVRRKFVDAQSSDPARASEALAFIRTLYAVEREIKEQQLVGDDVVAMRQARAGPILTRFGDWVEQHHHSSLPKSPLGEALTYAHNQWPSLSRYLTDSRFAIDNNRAERAIRPLAVGRKNWLFIGGDAGLRRASVLLTLCVSAKQHNLNPWLYLTNVLTKMSTHPTDLNPLLPNNYAKQRP